MREFVGGDGGDSPPSPLQQGKACIIVSSTAIFAFNSPQKINLVSQFKNNTNERRREEHVFLENQSRLIRCYEENENTIDLVDQRSILVMKRTPSYLQDLLELGVYLFHYYHQIYVYGQHKLLLEQFASGLSFGNKICGDLPFWRIVCAIRLPSSREKLSNPGFVLPVESNLFIICSTFWYSSNALQPQVFPTLLSSNKTGQVNFSRLSS